MIKKIGVLVLFCTINLFADYKEDIELTRLEEALADFMPSGANIPVTIIESSYQGNFQIDMQSPLLSGKKIDTFGLPNTNISFHATHISELMLGLSLGVAPDIIDLTLYNADYWLNEVLLGEQTDGEPTQEKNLLQNHSWIGSKSSETTEDEAIEIIQRFDYSIMRDDYLSVVTLENSADLGLPDLLCHNYNGITVGRSDGEHSIGLTEFDQPGRVKPELVVPMNSTSWAAPIVSGCAALLMEVVQTFPRLENANHALVIKALLLAGATKHELSEWTQTPVQPLDPHFGAGELNIFNSYTILAYGQSAPDPSQTISIAGWDYNTLTNEAESIYYYLDTSQFEDSKNSENPFSIILTWFREIQDTDPGPDFKPSSKLPDFNMALYKLNDENEKEKLAESRSPVDNVEHMFLPLSTSAQYLIEISSDLPAQYALAWRFLE